MGRDSASSTCSSTGSRCDEFRYLRAAGGAFRAVDRGFDTTASDRSSSNWFCDGRQIDASKIVQQSGGGPVFGCGCLEPASVTLTPRKRRSSSHVTGATDTSVIWTLSAALHGYGRCVHAAGTVATAQSVTVIAPVTPTDPNSPPPRSISCRTYQQASPHSGACRRGGFTDPLGKCGRRYRLLGAAHLAPSRYCADQYARAVQGERWSLTPFQYQSRYGGRTM